MSSRLLVTLVCLQMIVAVLWFGAAHVATWSALTMVSLLLITIWAFDLWRNRLSTALPWPIWLALGVLGICFILPLTIHMSSTLPLSAPLRQYARQMDIAVTCPAIINPYQARLALYQWLLPLSAFLVLPAALASRRLVYCLAGSLVALAGLEGIYGIAQALASSDPLPIFVHPDRQGQVPGTFICRNNYAVFLAAVVPLALGLLSDLAQRHQPSVHLTWREQFSYHVADNPRLPWLLATFAACLGMALGIVLSLSRAGLACLLLGVIVWMLLWQRGNMKANDSYGWLLYVLLPLPLLAYLSMFDLDPLFDRISTVSADSTGRLEIAAVAWVIFRHHVWFGCGGDCFRFAFEMYKPAEITNNYRYAHNDFLQFMAEYGSVTTVAMAAFLLVWAYYAMRSRCRTLPGVWRGCLAGVVALFFHGFMDFSLQINSQRMVCAIFMAIALALNARQSDRQGTGN
jgi:hypothetical protein